MKDYYAVLQLDENADHAEIKQSYRRLALLYHPDVNKSANAHEKFCEITEAYEFLTNHWPQHLSGSPATEGSRQKYADYRRTEEYEKFRAAAREKAQRQARMRYEKFKKQHDAFQESGINDIGLLITSFFRLLSIPFVLGLLLIPVVFAVWGHWTIIILSIVAWPLAGFIAWYMYDNRKNYLLPGTLYYSPHRIRHLFTDTHPSDQRCYYCNSRMADSKPYILDLLKLKDLKLRTEGIKLHQVNYINENIRIHIPRSRKAFIVHSLVAMLKLLSILFCLLFLPVTSVVWRTVFGIITGGIIGALLFLVADTRSNVSYLISTGVLLRICVWLTGLLLVSRITYHPFDIHTTEAIYFVITAIIIFDSFLMQLIDLVFGKIASRPIPRQYPEVKQKFYDGYKVYNDIPVLSVIYPMFKWIVG